MRNTVSVRRELSDALFSGVFETPLWSTFLDKLKEATEAHYATLIFCPPGRRMEEALHLLAGDVSASSLEFFFRENAAQLEPTFRDMVPLGRAHSLDELLDLEHANSAKFYRRLVEEKNLRAIRQVQVREPSGIYAWLTIARAGADFSQEDSALLDELAPILRGVLRLYIAMDRERYAASLTAEAARRLRFGWIALDASGTILATDEQCAGVLTDSGILKRGSSGRLTANTEATNHKIAQALRVICERPESKPQPIILSREPWMDMLLVSGHRRTISTVSVPAAIAYVHGDNLHSVVGREQLAGMFGLSPREAQLALVLAQGLTIAEAAEEMGITVKSARTYSKSIYAKMGARGLPDLVRMVMRSIFTISHS